MKDPHRVDAVIVGAGPVGLFCVFQLGLFDIRCYLIDSLDRPGGQCAELYADKPIYDIPGFPSIVAQELIDRLMQQIAPFRPTFSFNRLAVGFDRVEGERFAVTTDDGEIVEAPVVVIAAGGGPLQAKRPTARRGSIAQWGLDLHGDLIAVDAEKFQTSEPGVFAVGDVNWYPGKLRLILSGFHEAALMTQAVRMIIKPGERAATPYTSSSKSLRKKLGVA